MNRILQRTHHQITTIIIAIIIAAVVVVAFSVGVVAIQYFALSHVKMRVSNMTHKCHS